jgi:Iap family predicted aminopeptidase
MTLAISMMVLVSLAAAPVAAAESPSDADVVARLAEEALGSRRAFERLAWLTDRIGHRLSGSKGLEKAVAWTEKTLREDGLDKVWTEPVMVPHWERGTARASITAPIEREMAVLAIGMSVATPAEGVTGEVIVAGNLEELKSAGEAVRGKIVLFNKPIVANGGRDRGYGSAAGLRVRGPVEAARLGAAAMLLRSLGTADYRLPHTGSLEYDPNVPAIPSAAIAAEDAELIARLASAGERVRVRLELTCRSHPDAPSANVLAEWRGRERPEEIVLIGAHLDSWDVGAGAHDNGAGVAIVMETMRLLRALDLRPRRTVRAVLFTNEENGTRGSRAYFETHRGEVNRHVAAIESDSGGARPLGFGVSAGPGGFERVREIAAALAGIGAGEVKPRGGGVDVAPLRDAGVPALSLNQDMTRYFDYHHTEADTLDKVDPADLARNVAAMAVMAYRLADMPDPLPRQVPKASEKP